MENFGLMPVPGIENPEKQKNKIATTIILQQANEIFGSSSSGLSQTRPLEIEGEQFFLQYDIYPQSSGQIWTRVGLYECQPPSLIQNTSFFNVGEVAMTRLMFSFQKSRVSGEVATHKNFEGRGFGSAMIFMKDGIIKDIARRYRDEVSSDGITSEIVDNSRSSNSGKQYEGWTTSKAQKMGYQQVSERKFVKRYKRDDLAEM